MTKPIKKEEEKNGYFQAAKLRKARRRFHIPTGPQALFYELLSIWNEYEWDTTFLCSNGELCNNLSVQEKSLIQYRSILVDAGLIYYKSGKSRKEIGSYSFTEPFDYCKNYSHSASPVYEETGSPADIETGSHIDLETPDYIDKLKLKTKTETKTSLSGAKAPVKKPTEKNEFPKTEHWAKIVDAWFIFYKQNFIIEPTFTAEPAKNLKKIIERIKILATTNLPAIDWNEENAIKLFTKFLNNAYQEQWLRDNFLLSNLYSKFDSIAVKKTQNGKQQTGAAVSTESAFDKIDQLSGTFNK